MKKMSEPVVFFGSGPVAARSLALLADNATIEAVITKPKPAHHKETPPVQQVATALNLPLMAVASRKELDSTLQNSQLKSHLGILIDFGIIVSQYATQYFPLGIVNSHFSLLPLWRGADPITFSLLSGQTQTGVSLMLLSERMDEGPLLAQRQYKLTPTITGPELTEALIRLSHELLIQTLPKYIIGAIQPYPQDAHIQPSYSRKLVKADGKLNWQKPAEELEREVRAFLEWPKSFTTLGRTAVIVTKAAVSKQKLACGELAIDHNRLLVGTQTTALDILELKPSGKQSMTAQAFLAGYSLS